MLIRSIDWLAHLLYEPAMLWHRCAVVPEWKGPLHRIHLIPGSWLEKVCNAYDRHLGVTDNERHD